MPEQNRPQRQVTSLQLERPLEEGDGVRLSEEEQARQSGGAEEMGAGQGDTPYGHKR